MSVARLIDVLERSGVELDPVAILDAFWLAKHHPTFNSCGDTRLIGAPDVKPSPTPPRPHNTPINEPSNGEETPDQPSSHYKGPLSYPPVSSDSVPAFPGADPFGSGRKASGLSTMAATPQFESLAFQQALRPFRAHFISHHSEIVEEEATVHASAELSVRGTLRIAPVVVSARERWFHVDLVTEDDAAIEVWREALIGFAQTMRNSGAFRDVREWRLDLGLDARGPASLRTRVGATLPASALAGGERRLILFASHGSSIHWSSGAYARLLTTWAKNATVALIHLLPTNYWARTALGEATGLAATDRQGVANTGLKFEPFWWLLPGDPVRATPFPLIDLSPEGIGEWAGMLMARGGPSPATTFAASASWETSQIEHRAESEAAIRQRIGALLSTAPRAFRLAVLLSDAPFTVPVARLIQEAHFGRSDHQDLARLFVSGLLSLQPDQTRDPSSRWFLIRPDAAAILRLSLRPGETEAIGQAVIRRVSDHIANATGSRPTMTSFMPDENGDSALPDWAKPFALVAARLMTSRTRGGTPKQAQEASSALDRVLRSESSVLAVLVGMAVSDSPLHASELPTEAWTTLLDRTLTTIDGGGHRRFTDLARAALIEINQSRPLLGARILWVDDQPGGNKRLSRELTAQGAAVVRALTTTQAMQQVGQGFDVIISNMVRREGKREGFVLLKQLREQRISTPVIIYSARFAYMRANRAAAVRAGAYYCTDDSKELVRHLVRLYQEPGAPADEVYEDVLAEPLESFGADNWAFIVSGADRPELPRLPDIEGDVRAFIEWLKAPIGGGVPVDHLRILAAPENMKDLERALTKLLDQCSGARRGTHAKRRLYFYFYGRCLRLGGETFFLLANIFDDAPDSRVPVRAVMEFVAHSGCFDEVVMVITGLAGDTTAWTSADPLLFGGSWFRGPPARQLAIYGLDYGRSASKPRSFTRDLVEGLNGEAADSSGEVSPASLENYLKGRLPSDGGVDVVIEAVDADNWILSRADRRNRNVNIVASSIFVGSDVLIDGIVGLIPSEEWSVRLAPGSHVIELPSAGIRKMFHHSEREDAVADVRLSWKLRDRAVLVAGTGQYELSDAERWICEAVGNVLATAGFSLVTGGWPGVDHVVSAAYARKVSSEQIPTDRWLTQILRHGSVPDFQGGRVIISDDFPSEMIEAVVLVGGLGGTFEAFERASRAGKRVYPIPGTGGDAKRAFDLLVHLGGQAERLRRLDRPVNSEEAAYEIALSLVEILLDPA